MPSSALPDRQLTLLKTLNFTATQVEPYALLLNGVPLFPQPVAASEPLFAPVTKAGDDQPSMGVRLGYELDVQRKTSAFGGETVSVAFSIVQVAGRFTTAFDTVDIKLLKKSDATLHILDTLTLKAAPPLDGSASPSEQEKAGGAKECARLPLLCKLRAIVAAKLAALRKPFKGFHHARPHHRPLTIVSTEDAGHASAEGAAAGQHDQGHAVAAHHQQGHHRHHHRHGRHGFLRGLVMHVVFPMMVGVAAGMTASLVGMVLGQLVVFLWRRYYRGDRRGPYILLVDEEEKAPSYEDAVSSSYPDEKALLKTIVEEPEYELESESAETADEENK